MATKICVNVFMVAMLACVVGGPTMAIVQADPSWLLLDFALVFYAI